MSESPKHFLDYENTASTETPPRPSTVLALLLAFPGGTCWALFALTVLFASRGRSLPISGETFSCSFFTAVATAITSIGFYLQQPSCIVRSWAVMLNLIINVSGLIFTGLLFALFLRII